MQALGGRQHTSMDDEWKVLCERQHTSMGEEWKCWVADDILHHSQNTEGTQMHILNKF